MREPGLVREHEERGGEYYERKAITDSAAILLSEQRPSLTQPADAICSDTPDILFDLTNH